jgi:hypothetical protein
MKIFIILATFMASSALAAEQYVKLGDIKGEATEQADDSEINGQIEMLSPNLEVIDEEENEVGDSRVIDNAEESAEEVKDGVRESGEGATGQARRRSDVTMKDVSLERGKSSTKAQDYNSSRSNKRGARGNDETHTGTPKSKRKLDTDDDGDSIKTEKEND